MYELIIIGGGPAGAAAAVYAARKKIKAAIVVESFGGQSLVSADIQNWIGAISISGFELVQNLENHVRAQKDLEILDGEKAAAVEKKNDGFLVLTESGKKLETKTILVCSGSRRRKLGIKGEDEFNGKGVMYCSTCDAPIFKDKTVAVVGGGNAGLEAVRDLISYAGKIYLMELLDKITGDIVTLEEIKKNPKVEIITKAEIKEILGNEFVTGLKYLDGEAGQLKELKLDGVFVEIGSVPNVEFLGDLAQKNKHGEIIVDCLTQQTSYKGIWAAGDASSCLYKQNNIAAGDAIKAVLNIYEYLNKVSD